ncbi:MAG TPA: two-component regulator propeller domain-containing protein, partial [Daejeonella sp.]|nr:two-component regulator propeller domain-containing protein [Daejeonella sp.]
MRNLILFFLFLLTSNIVVAQKNRQDINFKHISYKEGLVQSPIATFLQDDRGFIWFGNLKGLTRYDGYEFKTFTFDENDKHSLSNNKVKVIFQDTDKNLWIGTANGVNLYNRDLETFTPIDVREIKGGRNYISSIVEDQQKNIWVGTFAGVKRLNKKTRKLEDGIAKKSEVLNSGSIFSLYSDHENTIWAGTKSGLKRFNPKNSQELELPSPLRDDPGVSKSKVLVIKQDHDQNYWFGTEESGVIKYQKNQNNLVKYQASERANSLASNWVKDILIYDQNTLWFATRNGVSILNIDSNQFTNHSHNPLNLNSLNDNAIWSFLKDKAGCVWIGTFAGGINFYYKGNSNFLNIGESIGNNMALNHLLVNALTEDKDGSIWVGTYGGGVNHINRDGKSSNYHLLNLSEEDRLFNDIKSLADDGKGNLWVGTLDGLALFDKNAKTFKHFGFPVKDGKLSENLINVVLPDGEGAWVGTNGGGLRYVLPDGRSILHLRKEQNSFVNNQTFLKSAIPLATSIISTGNYNLNPRPEISISDNFVTALLKDLKGNLWVGTQDGLNYYDVKAQRFTKVFKKVRNIKYQISKSYVSVMFMDSSQRLWVGTDGGGLNYFDQKTNRFYP